jgi:hypothetical protein
MTADTGGDAALVLADDEGTHGTAFVHTASLRRNTTIPTPYEPRRGADTHPSLALAVRTRF